MNTRSRGGLGRCRIRTGPGCRGCRVASANTAAPRAHPLAPVWIASYAGRRVTDINVFVRLSRRNAEREAVGLARMRQQVKAGKLKVAWMSEEEKAAYRLQEAPEAGATVASDPGEYEPGEVSLQARAVKAAVRHSSPASRSDLRNRPEGGAGSEPATRSHRRPAESAYGGRFVLFCAGEAGTRINGLPVSHPADCEKRRFEDLA